MKKIHIILGLSALFFIHSNLRASDNPLEAQQIKNLILNYLPEHTFPLKKDLHESAKVTITKNEINLIDEELTNEGMKNLAEKIMTDPYREEIQTLNLQQNQIGNSGAISLASTLDYLKALEELDIRYNPIGLLGLQAILIKASQLGKLSSIKFSCKEKDMPELKKITGRQINPLREKNNFEALLNFEK